MLRGRIGNAKDESMPGWWYAECETVGAYTQGKDRADAMLMLADCIETLSQAALKVTVTETGPTDGDEIAVLIHSNTPDVLEALIQQQTRGG